MESKTPRRSSSSLQTKSSSSKSSSSKSPIRKSAKASKNNNDMSLSSSSSPFDSLNKSSLSSTINSFKKTSTSTTDSSKTKYNNSASSKKKKSSRSSRNRRSSSRSRELNIIDRIFHYIFFKLSRDYRIIFLLLCSLIIILTFVDNNITTNVMNKYKNASLLYQDGNNADTADYKSNGELYNNGNGNNVIEDFVPELNGLKNVWDENDISDVPIFWHIAKTGGTSIKNVLSHCYKRTLASEVGIRDGHAHDTTIQVFNHNGFPYVNVDTSTALGIERAFAMKLMNYDIDGLVIVSPWVHNIERLFMDDKDDNKNENNVENNNDGEDVESTSSSTSTTTTKIKKRGRVFGIFREPIDRAVSMFHYLQYATWEPSYNPILKNMTLEQYAESKYIENNFVTRILTGKYTGVLTSDDAMIATVILKRKILVGLQSKIMESMERYEIFFGLFNLNINNNKDNNHDPNYNNSSKVCREQLLSIGSNINIKKLGNLRNNHELPKEDTRTYSLISHHNRFDIQIYNLAVSMFDEQRSLVRNIEQQQQQKEQNLKRDNNEEVLIDVVTDEIDF